MGLFFKYGKNPIRTNVRSRSPDGEAGLRVYLPIGTEPCVKLGQKTTGNETIIAKLK